MNRKDFIKSAAVLAGAATITPFASASVLQNKPEKKVVLKKSLGLGMIKEELSLTDKFKLAKELGFDGVELNSPVDFKMSEVLEAKSKSGIELPSVVNKDHWSSPLSDPDPAVRKNVSTLLPNLCRK